MAEAIAADDRAWISDYRRNPLVMSGLPIFDLKLSNNGANNMAQGTHPAGTPPLAQMKPTPGVTPDVEAEYPEPHLNDDIDPVKLVRLYPEAMLAGGLEAVKAAAIKAGMAAREAAPHVVASQQVPVSGQEGQPPSSPGIAPPPRPAPPAAAAPTPPPPPPGTQWTPQQVAAWQAQQATRPPGA